MTRVAWIRFSWVADPDAGEQIAHAVLVVDGRLARAACGRRLVAGRLARPGLAECARCREALGLPGGEASPAAIRSAPPDRRPLVGRPSGSKVRC